jgi:hypothetical protein
VIENPSYSRKFHGEYELVGIGHFDLEERGTIAAARTETTSVKQGRVAS